MAKIVLGIASSHAPQLAMPPDQWRAHGDRTRRVAEHWFEGKTYSFPELAELRAESHFEKECTDEKFQVRFDACQKAIAHLAQTLDRVAPDTCIMLGDDQHEALDDGNMPSIAIYHGATIDDDPAARELRRGDWVDNQPDGRVTHPADARLGEYLVEALASDFDLARINRLREDKHLGAIGHAFYFLYRRLMNNEVIPHVPVLLNTYYPPNVPSAERCYRLGKAVRQAVEAWDSSARVALFASGGLSHTVIEEDLDYRMIDGLRQDDVAKLTDLPDVRFRSGTSEIKNWIATAGALSGSGLQFNLVDYVPCYRTEAGNGCAMGFAEWV